jgi:hypothetical protein
MLALFPVVGHAVTLRPLVGINAEFGGDRLLTVTYSDGSESDVDAGQGFSLFGGASVEDLIDFKPFSIDLQGTLGVKYATVQQASNGNIDFFRFPAELLAFVHWTDLRVGVGPTYHFANSLSGSGLLTGASVDFKDALGVVAQVDYTFAKQWNLGVRYTSITYEPKTSTPGVGKTDASNFGVELGYFFL